MSPRRSQKKTDNLKSELASQRGSMHGSDGESDDSNGYVTPPLDGSSPGSEPEIGKDEESHQPNESCCKWWLQLHGKVREERENCIKIHVLSPFLFGVVPPGLEDKVIDWSYECGLLPNKDIQQIFTPTDQTFKSIRVVEDAFCILADYWNSKQQILNILNLRDDFIKRSSVKAAIKYAEKIQWFKTLRSRIKLMSNLQKEMGDMSLLLAIYHFAGHIQSSSNENDVLKRFKQDCQLGEEKALELKNVGNQEFSSNKYRAAISLYSRAVGLSPFNHIVYGNRALSYIKVGDYKQALIDAKRATILKPDWEKGKYRFEKAVCALRESEGEKAESYLSFFVGSNSEKAKNATKERTPHATIKKKLETSKGRKNAGTEDDSEDESLPELVSADDSDTSAEDERSEKENESEMPELIDEENSSDSTIDEDDAKHDLAEKERQMASSKREKKKTRKVVAMIREEQRAKEEEQAKKIAEEQARKIAEEKAKKIAEEKAEKEIQERKREKLAKSEKPLKTKDVGPVDSLIAPAERKTQVEGILREASKALLDNSYEHASESYNKALGIIDAVPRKSIEFGDKSYVIVLYAYGTAMLGMGVQKELEMAKSTFEDIIYSFKSVDFPLAYYGLGRVYHQQNRFQEAIKPLEQGLNILEDRSFDKINWPGTDIVIEETMDKNMKVAFEEILTICKYPPKPDAICRFDSCSGIKKSIYKNDPDYKGFVRVACNDACSIEYHVHCWKKLKSEYTEKSTDKDFLDNGCLTVDCQGLIVGIQIHDVEGVKIEFQSEKPKPKKEIKPEKNLSADTVGGSKKKKRLKKKEFKTEVSQENDFPDGVQSKQDNVVTDADNKSLPSEEVKANPEKEEKKSEVSFNEKEKNSMSVGLHDISKLSDTGMFVVKKPDDQQNSQASKQTKTKNKKKKKNVQSLEEFLGRDSEHYRQRQLYYDDEDCDEIPSEPFTREPPPGWMANPFAIPAHLHNEAREIENSLNAYSSSDSMYRGSDPWKTDSIREYVYSSFIQLLKVEGSLHIDSERMKANLRILPEEAQKIVEEDGGLREFLSRSNLFTIELDIVTNLEEKLFTDLSKSYKKSQHTRLNSTLANENGCASLEFADISVTDGNAGNLRTPTSRESKPGSMNSLSSIGAMARVDNDLKVNCKSAFPGLNYANSKGKPETSASNDIKNKDLNAEKTEVVKWNTKANIRNDLGHGEENVLQEPQCTEDKAKKMDNVLPNQGNRSTASVVQSAFPETKAVSTTLNDAMSISEESVNETLKSNHKSNDSVCTDTVTSMSSDKDSASCYERSDSGKTLTNEQTEKENSNIIQGSSHSLKEGGAALIDAKCTKDKGIQAQPTVKNKTAMTEPAIEPYKVEYEKLLGESEGWNIKHQEALDKNVQLQKKYHLEIFNLNKKLQELTRQKQDSDKKLEEVESRYQQEVKNFQQEKREKSDMIKKLQEEIDSKSEVEERRIVSLRTEMTVLEARLQKEKEQHETEKGSVNKFKTMFQQQEQRACNAEVQLMELQRDVSFSFFTKALQEAEVTFHNIGQLIAVNPSPQLHEISQKWQRYINECKHQINHNKTQFETFLPMVKDKKPLASLTSLRIVRPGPYPGPPILHLPPSGIPPAHKPASLSASARSESPTSAGLPVASATTGFLPINRHEGPRHQIPPAPVSAVRPDGPRHQVPQPVSVNQTTTVHRFDNSSALTSGENLRRPAEQPQKASNSFEKIMLRLSTLFPSYSRTQMTNFIKEVRASKNGSLTGLSFDDIVSCVTQLVKARENQAVTNTATASNESQQVAAVPNVQKTVPVSTPAVSLPKPIGAPSKPAATLSKPVTTSSKPVTNLPNPPIGTFPQAAAPEPLASVGATAQISQKSSGLTYEDDPCVICHDEMSASTRNVALDCGHKFHHDCIKKWLVGEQSTCPTCRVHALLPEEFPQLK